MPQKFKKILLVSVIGFISVCAKAQGNRPSPEVEQIYHHAQEYVISGDLKDAIITYKQAILIAPDKMILYKELGKAQYLSGNFSDAEQTLSQLQTMKEADPECFQILAASQFGEKKTKESGKTLRNGLSRFPASGLLYNETGNEYASEDKRGDALNAWLDGILRDPGYPENYYDAAISYLGTQKVFWGIIYGEIFLNMGHDSTTDDTIKQMLFTGYKTLFDNIAAEDMPQYGKIKTKGTAKSFEESVLQVYRALTPVISDGITTENLAMVRTRFLMDWFAGYSNKYPFSLFSYQDDLVRNGRFEIYNEWVFGKAENELQYEAWSKFHDGDIARFMQWRKTRKIRPVSADFYNDRNMDGLFERNRK